MTDCQPLRLAPAPASFSPLKPSHTHPHPDGTLWELTHNAVWRHHRPPRTAHGQAILLAPMSGIVAPLQGSKHIYMLLLAADGSGLVERGWTGEKFWWRFHPAPDGVTLGGPLTLIFVPSRGSREIHASVVVLALNGTALEFNTWTAHQPSLAGRLEPGDVWGVLDVPGGALAPVAGAVIDDGGQVIHIFMLADGCLARAHPNLAPSFAMHSNNSFPRAVLQCLLKRRECARLTARLCASARLPRLGAGRVPPGGLLAGARRDPEDVFREVVCARGGAAPAAPLALPLSGPFPSPFPSRPHGTGSDRRPHPTASPRRCPSLRAATRPTAASRLG